MAKQPARLGRGLEALLGNESHEIRTNGSSTINEIELDKIVANPNQPRKNFDAESLQTLSASIAEMGVIAPITLRKNEDDTYMIIAGERRFRAAQLAGLHAIPAYIRTVDDEQLMELALIENIQREDLDAIEIALGYQRLIEEYNLTHEQVSQKVGMSRTNVSNYLRLLNLPAEVQMGLQNKLLDMGHARALLSVADPQWQLNIYKQILEKGLSVRQVENMARMYNEQSDEPKTKSNSMSETDIAIFENLKNKFGDKLRFACNQKGKGQITIPFDNRNQLQQFLDILGMN